MKRWERIIAEITDFRKLLCSDAPAFSIEFAYDYEWSNGPLYKQSRKDWRYSHCGVYLIFSGAEELVYIGVAMYSFDKRIWTHPNLDELGARHIDLIPFDDRFKPMAVALEWFLITRLKPNGNKVAVGYEVPVDPAK
jgi:hypothetical protein